jgi:hypothetical protein
MVIFLRWRGAEDDAQEGRIQCSTQPYSLIGTGISECRRTDSDGPLFNEDLCG